MPLDTASATSRRDGLDPSGSSPAGSSTSSAAADEAAAAAGTAPGAGADPFIGDAGPGFRPGEPPPEPDAGGPELEALAVAVDEDAIRDALRNLGDGAHAVAGVGELDWCMTAADLDRIAPPLTRIVNRYPALAAVAGHSDELALSIGTGLYTWRSMLERQAVLRAREQPQPAPAAGQDHQRRPPPAAEPAAPSSSAAGGGATVETPDGYQTAAERLRATRPEG